MPSPKDPLKRRLWIENLSKAHRGQKCYWTGKKRPSPSKKTKEKMSEAHKGVKSYAWKGEDVSYVGLHQWIIREKGKAKICSECERTNKETRIHWSNIDHKYRRNLDDYIQLCPRCHKKYDMENGLCKH